MKNRAVHITILFMTLFLFLFSVGTEATVWARAGGGSSFGSRSSRSFSTPRMPSSPSSRSPGLSSPGRSQFPGSTSQPSTGGFFSRSPFMQGMAGGLAGGFLGNLLFGGAGHAAHTGGAGGGGIGLMDILILGLLFYIGWRIFSRRYR